jgi:hypothetical protein
MADEPTVVDVDISDADLFNEAMAGKEAPSEPAAAETPENEPQPSREGSAETGSQPRDEHGRFAPKAGDAPAADAAPPPHAPQPTDGEKEGWIPSWRHREEAENRRAAEARAQQYERELAELRRSQPKPEPPKAPEPPDPLLDPAGYQAHMRSEWQSEIKNVRGELSFEFARSSNPARFDQALAAVQQASPAEILRVKDAPNPGRELLAWYAQHERTTIVGNDLDAYNKKVREEALKDPEFLKQALAFARLSVVPSTNGARSPSPVRLPPSLNSMSPSGAALGGDDDGDLSDEALFRHATTGMRR